MLVNKRCYKVVKHFIENTPTIYIATYFIDISGEAPKKVIYNSLRELFTELYQFRLNIQNDNYAGSCDDCLKCSIRDDTKYECGCNDVNFIGIRMVKSFNVFTEPLIDLQWCSSLKSLVNPKYNEFRMSKKLYTECNIDYDSKNKYSCNDRKSMSYLYYGYPKSASCLKKNGKKYYPITTDNMDKFYLVTLNRIHKNIFKNTDTGIYSKAWIMPKVDGPVGNRRNDI